MDVRLLGPVELHVAGEVVPLAGGRARALVAILALRRGTTVGREVIADALWGTEPPLTADKQVQILVSRVRRVLAERGEGDRIVTRPGGYALRVEASEVDVAQVEVLVAAAREADDAAVRGHNARAALEAWAGRPLADLAEGPVTRAERARLEALHSEAAELAVQAALDQSRPTVALTLLERLLADDPLRDRLHELRMLALYRAGRQADALAAFREARRLLVDGLGIEPGPRLRELHDAVLAQDPRLEARPGPAVPQYVTAVREAPPAPDPRRTRRTIAAAAVGALVLIVVLVAAAAPRGGTRPPAVLRAAPDSLVAVDPDTGRVVTRLPVGTRPGAVLSGAGGVWVVNHGDDTLTRVDPVRRRVVRSLAPGGSLAGAVVAGDRVWSVDDQAHMLRQVDPVGSTVRRHPVTSYQDPYTWPADVRALAAESDGVWTADDRARVALVDRATGRVTRREDLGFLPSGLLVDHGWLWAADPLEGAVTRMDVTGATTSVPVGGSPGAIAAGVDGVFLADALMGAVAHVDPARPAVRATIRVGGHPSAIAVDGHAVWVATGSGRTLVRIDGLRDRVVRRLRFDQAPTGVTMAKGLLWVSLRAAPRPPGPARGRLRMVIQDDYRTLDPALNIAPTAWQLDYAICGLLVNVAPVAGTAGTRLRPDLATALPRVSDGGRTYTFRIRPGRRFSPPSGAPVTSSAIKHGLERALDPALGGDAATYVRSIVGERAFLRGDARHIAGIVARGDELVIRIERRSPEFLAQLAMPFFCTVPKGTPARRGLDLIASAGPYHVAEHVPGERKVLRRNPGYVGDRPRRPEEIDVLVGTPAARQADAVVGGRADYATDLPGPVAVTARRIPPASRVRLHAEPLVALHWLLVNGRQGVFRSARLRRALGFALDRRAIASVPAARPPGQPTDQYLPPDMPGFEDADVYPLDGPDLRRARALAGSRHRRATLLIVPAPWLRQEAATIVRNLAAIGISVRVRVAEGDLGAAARKGWDLSLLFSWFADYLDPSEFLNVVFEPHGLPGVRTPPRFVRRLRTVGRIAPGPRRWRAYAALDEALAREVALPMPLFNHLAVDALAPHVGCRVHQPLYGVDLAGLCSGEPP